MSTSIRICHFFLCPQSKNCVLRSLPWILSLLLQWCSHKMFSCIVKISCLDVSLKYLGNLMCLISMGGDVFSEPSMCSRLADNCRKWPTHIIKKSITKQIQELSFMYIVVIIDIVTYWSFITERSVEMCMWHLPCLGAFPTLLRSHLYSHITCVM
jgi:hypothetical protein